MTKKDYEAIAFELRVIRQTYGDDLTIDRKDLIDKIAEGLSEIMKADNGRFDRHRFMAACKGQDSHDSAGRKVRYSGRA